MDVLTEGYALPVSGGLYPPPPYLYRGATAIIASYEADPAAITGLLPPGVSPLEDPPVRSSAAGRPPSPATAPISSIPAARSSIPVANTASPTAWRRSPRTGL